MSNSQAKAEIDVAFIRLFFPLKVEEIVAHRWATRLGRLLGVRVMKLRPDTTLSEMLAWASTAGVYSMDFVFVFEPELRLELTEFLDDADHATFREMVEHCAKQVMVSV